VSLSILDNPGSAGLFGQTTISAAAGVATFNDLTLDKRAADYTLLASAASLIPDTSATFGISATAPSAATSTVTLDPNSGIFADSVQLSTITVVVRDSFANTAPGHAVVLSSSGSGNTIVQPPAPTDAVGTAIGTITSTVAEAKTVTATVDGTVIVLQQPVVAFVPDTGASATLSTVVAAAGTRSATNSATCCQARPP
jgi:adhesin/invasin